MAVKFTSISGSLVRHLTPFALLAPANVDAEKQQVMAEALDSFLCSGRPGVCPQSQLLPAFGK